MPIRSRVDGEIMGQAAMVSRVEEVECAVAAPFRKISTT